MNKRNYLLILKLAKFQPEHRELAPALHKIDPGAILIRPHELNIFALVQTSLDAHEIDHRLTGAVLNDDQRLIVELGLDYHSFRMDAFAGWLRTHTLA